MSAGCQQLRVEGVLKTHEPMSRHTSWRVGGPAECYFQPASVDDLSRFLAELDPETPILWVGLGSNLLVRDGGLRGVVIATSGLFNRIERLQDNQVRAEAGVPCTTLARQCVRWHLGPAAFFAGIPGTVGGALAMNAGAFGGETWRQVVGVKTMDRYGALHERAAEEFKVGYRCVAGPAAEWFISATFRFERQPDTSLEEIKALVARRKQTQPIGQPSCGSVFRNPDGDHAARLIETAGLKGASIGGAVVSEKHANFIINRDGASAADLESLIEHVRRTVQEKHGVLLELEVKIVGEHSAEGVGHGTR
jgi:UDP-N-acetylmuramate dehydrogenase